MDQHTVSILEDYHMGITAENIASQWCLTRQELDEFAAEIQRKALAAQKAGLFNKEIIPIQVKKKHETVIFDKDEGLRTGVTSDSIAKLRLATLCIGGGMGCSVVKSTVKEAVSLFHRHT